MCTHVYASTPHACDAHLCCCCPFPVVRCQHAGRSAASSPSMRLQGMSRACSYTNESWEGSMGRRPVRTAGYALRGMASPLLPQRPMSLFLLLVVQRGGGRSTLAAQRRLPQHAPTRNETCMQLHE